MLLPAALHTAPPPAASRACTSRSCCASLTPALTGNRKACKHDQPPSPASSACTSSSITYHLLRTTLSTLKEGTQVAQANCPAPLTRQQGLHLLLQLAHLHVLLHRLGVVAGEEGRNLHRGGAGAHSARAPSQSAKGAGGCQACRTMRRCGAPTSCTGQQALGSRHWAVGTAAAPRHRAGSPAHLGEADLVLEAHVEVVHRPAARMEVAIDTEPGNTTRRCTQPAVTS